MVEQQYRSREPSLLSVVSVDTDSDGLSVGGVDCQISRARSDWIGWDVFRVGRIVWSKMFLCDDDGSLPVASPRRIVFPVTGSDR